MTSTRGCRLPPGVHLRFGDRGLAGGPPQAGHPAREPGVRTLQQVGERTPLQLNGTGPNKYIEIPARPGRTTPARGAERP